MSKNTWLLFSIFLFLDASFAQEPCLAPTSTGTSCANTTPSSTPVGNNCIQMSAQSLATFSGNDDYGKPVADIFFLGTTSADNSAKIHLFCLEIYNSTPFFEDLGCVQGVLQDGQGALEVNPNDPNPDASASPSPSPSGTPLRGNKPERYVSNSTTAGATRVHVIGSGSNIAIKDQY
jgi:hypothetical protein